jgi:RNA-directed DNA polymerase
MKRRDWREPQAPPLVSFASPALLTGAVKTARVLDVAETEALADEPAHGLVPVAGPRVLANMLGVSPGLVRAMSDRPSRYYRRFTIPKASGAVREIATPRVYLKVVQWWILDRVLTPYAEAKLPDCVHGFRPGRGTVSAARPHLGARFILNLDIRDFFGSVSISTVRSLWREMGYHAGSAGLLTGLTTLDGALPQGAPTSPAIANLAFTRCDLELLQYAEAHGMQYTRYADDLSFSSMDLPPPDVVRRIRDSLLQHGFAVHPRKIRLRGPTERREVTGLVVSRKAQPSRRLRRALRARFHQANLHPEAFADDAARLSGWASYVNMYDPALGQRYLAIAARVSVGIES